MARKETDKQVNVILSESTALNLKQYLDETGLSRNETINKAIELLLLDKMQIAAPDQSANIKDFEMHIDKLLIAYRQSIERSLMADDRARQSVKSELAGMEALAETNKRLESEKTALTEKNEKLEKMVSEQEAKIRSLSDDLASKEATTEQVYKLTAEVIALQKEKADLLVKHNEEIARLNKEKINDIVDAAIRSAHRA